MLNKENFICTIPFSFTEIHDNKQYLCCPGWIGTEDNHYHLSIYETDDVVKNFNSLVATEFKESILDGSYKHCNSNLCPRLSSLKSGNHPSDFVLKTESLIQYYRNKKTIDRINFCFDRSCNLKCPTCRSGFINYTGDMRDSVEKKLQVLIESNFGGARTLLLSGSADPFFSKSFRNFLINFDKEKHKSLKSIYIQTNASLLNEAMWLKLKNVHSLIHTFDISIDAATKDTYENKVRLGGNWDILMSNLQFITQIPSKNFIFSMVVQNLNFREMFDFYTLIDNLMKPTKRKYQIYYSQIQNWLEEPAGKFLEKNVADINNEYHDEFLIEFNKISRLPNIHHNLHHLIKPIKPTNLI